MMCPYLEDPLSLSVPEVSLDTGWGWDVITQVEECNHVLCVVQVGWVKADTKAIQAIGDQIITHNAGVSVSGDFVSTFNLHIK